jgi:hypothetical protein
MMTMRRFDEIRLPSKQVVRWRFLDRENRWEIAAYRIPTGNELLRSVTGEPIQRWSTGGPSTDEFSEALGIVVMSASLRVQSDRINGRRNLQ